MRHLAQQPVDQAVEELVPAADVPVDGGDRNPEFLGETAHGEGIHAVELDQASRGVEDGLGVDRFLQGVSPPVIRSDSGRSR